LYYLVPKLQLGNAYYQITTNLIKKPLYEDKGLPPIERIKSMPTVKPPKKDTPKKN
jgi:hypothetical protein